MPEIFIVFTTCDREDTMIKAFTSEDSARLLVREYEELGEMAGDFFSKLNRFQHKIPKSKKFGKQPPIMKLIDQYDKERVEFEQQNPDTTEDRKREFKDFETNAAFEVSGGKYTVDDFKNYEQSYDDVWYKSVELVNE